MFAGLSNQKPNKNKHAQSWEYTLHTLVQIWWRVVDGCTSLQNVYDRFTLTLDCWSQCRGLLLDMIAVFLQNRIKTYVPQPQDQSRKMCLESCCINCLRFASCADPLCSLRVGGTGGWVYMWCEWVGCQWITRWEGGWTLIDDWRICSEMWRNPWESSERANKL